MKMQPHPSATGKESDRVFTPPDIAQLIVDALPLSGRVLDPARGQGAFYEAFPASCEKDWCEVDEGRDFFDCREKFDWIVTNPPWSIMRQFLQQGMLLGDNVVYLATTNHLFTKARVNLIADMGFGYRGIMHVPTPPYPWPRSGFQLSAVWLQRGYQAFTEIKKLTP